VNAVDRIESWFMRFPIGGTRMHVRRAMAEMIVARPQEFTDALVDAGVLSRATVVDAERVRRGYAVVPEPPHVHQWEVSDLNRLTGLVQVQCGQWPACDGGPRLVENRLPLGRPTE
jgi:D-serine deaminase-like pyridoxal phosphate-dependent protein